MIHTQKETLHFYILEAWHICPRVRGWGNLIQHRLGLDPKFAKAMNFVSSQYNFLRLRVIICAVWSCWEYSSVFEKSEQVQRRERLGEL